MVNKIQYIRCLGTFVGTMITDRIQSIIYHHSRVRFRMQSGYFGHLILWTLCIIWFALSHIHISANVYLLSKYSINYNVKFFLVQRNVEVWLYIHFCAIHKYIPWNILQNLKLREIPYTHFQKTIKKTATYIAKRL